MTRLLVLLAALGLATAATACSGGTATPLVATAAGTHPSTTVVPRTTTQLIHTAAQCVRQHGLPNFPDPVIDARGALQVDDQMLRALPAAVQQALVRACQTQIDAAQAAANALQPAATPQEIAQDTHFAQCMRQHGWPNFPDPDPNGKFSASTPGAVPASKTDPAFQACRSLIATSGH